jgi:hypothetical protein
MIANPTFAVEILHSSPYSLNWVEQQEKPGRIGGRS